MRVFLTGASGFLGSQVAEELLAAGMDVGVLLRNPGTAWRLKTILPGVTVIQGTLEAVSTLGAPLAKFAPDAIIHMAWHGVANHDRNDPAQASNIIDTLGLIAISAAAGAKVFVGAGSQAEYGPNDFPIAEDTPRQPTTLYGMAKLAAGTMAERVGSDRGIRFAWLRIFSTYGPSDADYWLIPSLIKSLRRRERMPLTGCDQKWGFLHRRDAARAFVTVVSDQAARGFFNLGSSEAPVLRETVMKLRDMVDPRAVLGFGDIPYRSDQVMTLQADTRRLRALGWSPKVSLDDGLRETVEWYTNAERS